MKRLILGALAVTALSVAVALSGSQKPGAIAGLQIDVEARNPWTNLRLNQDQQAFHFAIVSDRTGGHRARIFSKAVEQLNLLQPAFVISVGDLIEGYTKDADKLGEEWKEFQTYLARLQVPFFYVAGNHDISNTFQAKEWQERFGRRYYHFVYRDVLFLLFCSDNPDNSGPATISKDQIAFAQKVLKENAGVRWTIVALHRPLWAEENAAENGWLEVEKELAGRSYTVFAGHVHRYKKFVRNHMNYYQLATTGGSSRMRGIKYNEFDHLVWITMKKDGPVLANLLLDGIYAENMTQPVSDEDGVVITNRKPVYPVRGKLYFGGTPIPDAQVAFHLIDGKKMKRTADGLAEADGSFTVTTYKAFDGAPAGEYAVTVAWREDGRGPNRLPAKYARPETSELRTHIKAGTNEVSFNLGQ